jgi:hypothetical protein
MELEKHKELERHYRLQKVQEANERRKKREAKMKQRQKGFQHIVISAEIHPNFRAFLVIFR